MFIHQRTRLLAAFLISQTPLTFVAAAEPGSGHGDATVETPGPDGPLKVILAGGDEGNGKHGDVKRVLNYRDATGRLVEVYSDHPVTRVQAEAVLEQGAKARAAAEAARERAMAARMRAGTISHRIVD